MIEIKVSIFMLTYNQEQFIAQAIEGILMQETNFAYQLVIGEDFSADRTRAICEEYSASNPERIKLLPSYKNLGLINNFIRTYKKCDGKYVAICDGDDYWTDPLKLQKQVDFLENNSDYSIVFTSFNFLFPDGKIGKKNYKAQVETTGFVDQIAKNYICSATALFRNKTTLYDFPAWLDKCPYGDWPLYLWITRNGSKIKLIPDRTAVYRREIGVSEKMKMAPSRIAFENLKILEHINNDSNFVKEKQAILKSLELHRFSYLGCLIRERKYNNVLLPSIKLSFKNPLQVLKMYFYLLKRNLLKPKV